MIHYRKEHTGEASLDAQTVAGFETEYQEILDKAKEEYKRNEPSPYYREGYNLYRRMQEYKTEHLLFLHDMRGANHKQYRRTLFEIINENRLCNDISGSRKYRRIMS